MKQMNKTITQEGATALIRGWSVTCYGSIFYGGTYFFAYPFLKLKLSQKFPDHLPIVYFVSGFISEYTALLLYFPFETVKVRI